MITSTIVSDAGGPARRIVLTIQRRVVGSLVSGVVDPEGRAGLMPPLQDGTLRSPDELNACWI
jgi:hypothetical protein